MSTDPVTPTPEPPHGGRAWVRPVVLVAACLVIGFVGGWVVRGDDGPVTVLAPAPAADTAGTPTITTPGGQGGGTATAPGRTTTAPGTTSTVAEPTAPPDRADISLAVLNGTSQTGLAASRAGEAEGLGYVGVTAGNAPTSTSPSVVYYRSGQQAAAERVGKDLQIDSVQPLPASGALADAAPADAEVIVVLGPG
jgi:LytR cell envelope-related transcriptional attenuator